MRIGQPGNVAAQALNLARSDADRCEGEESGPIRYLDTSKDDDSPLQKEIVAQGLLMYDPLEQTLDGCSAGE